MGKKTKKAISVFALSIISSSVAAQTWAVGLKQVGVTLGWFMMIIMGIRWIMADSANERSDAKKGMLYIVVGLLIISMLCNLLCIYCDAAQRSVSANLCTNMNDYGCGFATCP